MHLHVHIYVFTGEVCVHICNMQASVHMFKCGCACIYMCVCVYSFSYVWGMTCDYMHMFKYECIRAHMWDMHAHVCTCRYMCVFTCEDVMCMYMHVWLFGC